jgi:hypothetical protein
VSDFRDRSDFLESVLVDLNQGWDVFVKKKGELGLFSHTVSLVDPARHVSIIIDYGSAEYSTVVPISER